MTPITLGAVTCANVAIVQPEPVVLQTTSHETSEYHYQVLKVHGNRALCSTIAAIEGSVWSAGRESYVGPAD